MSKQRVATVDRVVGYVRDHGPKTMLEISQAVHCCTSTASSLVREARRNSLLKRIDKDERGRLIFGAVQTSDWPERSAA